MLPRRFPECVQQASRAVSADPDYGPAHELLGRCYSAQGDYARAIPAFREALRYSQGRPVRILGRLGHALASSGILPEAHALRSELLPRLRRGDTGWTQFALLQIALKEYKQALDSLESAYMQRETELSFIAVEPLLDPVRAEPRYQQLIRKLGLTHVRP